MSDARLSFEVADEPQFTALAANVARAWRAADVGPLLVGLSGALGAGKTTWVRGMLRGLGYRGRVPSPTYTLLEQYDADGLVIVHVDLYRLGGGATDQDAATDIERLGLRDWLARERCWVLVEWPERSSALMSHLTATIRLEPCGALGRRIAIEDLTPSLALIGGLRGLSESPSS